MPMVKKGEFKEFPIRNKSVILTNTEMYYKNGQKAPRTKGILSFGSGKT